MRCRQIVVGLALSLGISALRTGTSGTATTKFVITWHTDDWTSQVRCVAKEDFRRWYSGEPDNVRKGDTVVTIPTDGALDSWEIEIEDQGRRVPHFECQMINAREEIECTASSVWVNTKLRQEDGGTTSSPCRVVIENQTPIVRQKHFYIKAFTTWDSASMQCIAETDILLGEGEILQGNDLLPESTGTLTLTRDQSPDDYECASEVMIQNFNPKFHGFVCSVFRNGEELCKAESWNVESKKNIVAELGGCRIQITDEKEFFWPVFYPADWGHRKFQITALSKTDSPSTITCWSEFDVETKEKGSVSAGTNLIQETIQKNIELNRVVTIIHLQKFDTAQERLRCQITVTEMNEDGDQIVLQSCEVKTWEKMTEKTDECEMHISLAPPAAE